jgi:hypothetical protein
MVKDEFRTVIEHYCPFQRYCNYYVAKNLDCNPIVHVEREVMDTKRLDIEAHYTCKALPEQRHCSYIHLLENAETATDLIFRILTEGLSD